MVFPLAQFVAMFNWSNMGRFMAVGLTDLLESSGMNGVPAFVGLALLSAFLCMFIASGSAIWSILAPIFVLLIRTDCVCPEVKKAFLFCCFCGLRISDLTALRCRQTG